MRRSISSRKGIAQSSWRLHLVTVISCLVLLCIWQVASWAIDAKIILPGPGPVMGALISIVSRAPFGLNVWATALRALESFVIIVITGSVFGLLAGFVPWVKASLRPILMVLKATPVMSVILLAFIWFSTGTVPVFSAFLMGFPVMFIQVVQGTSQMDQSLEQMCNLYDFSFSLKLKHYIIPSLLPSLITGARMTLSMVWKVVVAAEVITVPRYGIGSRMQMSQINLDTADVLAWTIVAILLTALGELLFDGILAVVKGASTVHARNAVPCKGGYDEA